MTTCCQITCTILWLLCEQLPYPPEHPRISRIRQGDKSDIPLLTLPYKYFLRLHSFSTLPSCIPKPISLAATSSKSPRTPVNLPQWFLKSSISFFLGKKWLSTSSSPRLIYSNLFLSLPYFFTFCRSIYLVYFFLPFCSSNPQTLGTERENRYPYRGTPPSMPRSIG